MDQSRIGFQCCVGIYQQCVRLLCYVCPISPLFPLPLPPSLSFLFCFLQPAWFLMVGGDRSFKLALKEEDEEFSDELREDCEVRGERMREEGGRGSQSLRWFQLQVHRYSF